MTTRQGVGRPIEAFDAMIAATARAHAAPLATRNVADFDGCGIRLVDPWAADQVRSGDEVDLVQVEMRIASPIPVG